MFNLIFLSYIDPGSGFTFVSLGGWLIGVCLSFLGIFLVFFKRFFTFFKKRPFMFIVFILLIVIGIVLITKGVNMSEKKSKFEGKIIILGLDALSPKIMESMMESEELPNFSRLKEKGSYFHLSTTNPSQSPVAWVAFATGRNPAKTGIFDFIVRDPKTYKLDLSLNKIEKGRPKKVVKSKAWWSYTSELKVPTIVITCPVTFPPDKVYGRMLSGMGVPDILGTEGTFTFYTSEHLGKKEEVEGNVFEIKKASLMNLNLIGPKRINLGDRVENIKVPLKVKIEEDKRGAVLEWQNKKVFIKEGQWSKWKEVIFDLSLFRKIKGIFKFYLVEVEPEFKLYISPINFDPRAPLFPISYPQSYSKFLSKKIGLYYTQGMPMDTWAVNQGYLKEDAFLRQVEEVFQEKKAMLDLELSRFRKGILFCYFESPDIIQHMFWRYRDVNHPLYQEGAPTQYKEVINTWYKKLDKVLGEVMKKIDEKDILIVLSDHGFDSFRRVVHINTWLRKRGYLKLKDSSLREGRGLLQDVDWTQTYAYSIGFGAIYINQKGREKYGIVNPGRETELLKEKISRELEKWWDDKYNQPVIRKVYKREEIFWGDYQDEVPDLYIGFNSGYRASWQSALGAVPEELIEDNLRKWSGTHLIDPSLIPGIIFSNVEILKQNPSLYDIAPTILKIIGFSKEEIKKEDFDGEPLF